jgi:hypothetical protein
MGERYVRMTDPVVRYLPHGVCFTKSPNHDHRCDIGAETKSVTLGYRAIEVVALAEDSGLSVGIEVHGGGWGLLIACREGPASDLYGELMSRWGAACA